MEDNQAQKVSESTNVKNEGESEGDSSYDSDAPPAKRQRTEEPDKSTEWNSTAESPSNREAVLTATTKQGLVDCKPTLADNTTFTTTTATTTSTSTITSTSSTTNGPLKKEALPPTTPAVPPSSDR